MSRWALLISLGLGACQGSSSEPAEPPPEPGTLQVAEDDSRILIETAELEAAIRKKGYVTGVMEGSLLDKKTGARDLGYGLDIADWIMEPGSDEEYRAQLSSEMTYEFNNLHHGARPKRKIEGPQICTQAKELAPTVIRGRDFIGVRMSYVYRTSAPLHKAGSTWEQTLVFPAGKRYFLSCDRIRSINASDAMFLRVDMPGHIKHRLGDTFSEVYLSYYGRIPSSAFIKNFPPDEKFLYVRTEGQIPRRFIRAYHLRDPRSAKEGPWLAGMTLDPTVVSEAWCHERGYVCLIEEFGGRPIRPGESFSAAFIVGYFDSIEEMEQVYDRYAGNVRLEAKDSGWTLSRSP
jgi:hypothetical protein